MTYSREKLELWAERVRRCLAEAGYVDGREVNVTVEQEAVHVAYDALRPPPREVFWRARELAEIAMPVCFAHFDPHGGSEECIADRRLMQDCRL